METFITSANRGSISTGYEIDNSLKLEADNSESLRTNSILVTPTNTKTGTFSFWVKRTELGANYLLVSGNSARYSRIFFNSDDQLQLYSGDSSWNSVQPITNAKFRDISAWYHIVLRIDSNNGTAGDRLRLYVNSVEQTWATSPNITQNGGFTLLEAFASPGYHAWGANLAYYSANAFFSGYLAEVHYVDGQSLAPTEFGETDDNGIWIPKRYSDAHGNCGYYLDFTDSGNLGDNKASSGSTFDFNENNITAIDQATDTPTNNFATINRLFKYPGSQVIKEGATKVTRTSGSGLNKTFLSTIGVNGGKWYAEFKPTASSNYVVGIIPETTHNTVAFDGNYIGNSAFPSSIGYYSDTGQKIIAPNGGSDYGGSYTTNDIISIALDMDNYRVQFHKNGVVQALSAYIDLTLDETTFMAFSYDSSGEMEVNFGGYHVNSLSSAATDENGYGSFEYAPPSGYLSLCTKNLASTGG